MKRRLKRLLTGVLCLSLLWGSVMTAAAQNANGQGEPQESQERSQIGYTELLDVSYGSDPRNTMDIYVPENLDSDKPNGAFILIYGGSWTQGDKWATRDLAKKYAEAGYVATAINMRNAYVNEEAGRTEITIYDMLNDVQGSVRRLKDLSGEQGWNITQCAVYGCSSGGNIAMLYAYSRGSTVAWFDTDEVLPVQFVVDEVGPVDMHESAWAGDEEWPDEDKKFTAFPGAATLYAMLLTGAANEKAVEELTEEEKEVFINSMSPVWYVDQFGGAPTVMGYSQRDMAQSPNNGKRLKSHLDAKGVPNELYTFLNSVHGSYADPEIAQEYFDKSIAYAQEYFGYAAADAEEPTEPAGPLEPAGSGQPAGGQEQAGAGGQTAPGQQSGSSPRTDTKASPKTGQGYSTLAVAAILAAAVLGIGAVKRKKDYL